MDLPDRLIERVVPLYFISRSTSAGIVVRVPAFIWMWSPRLASAIRSITRSQKDEIV